MVRKHPNDGNVPASRPLLTRRRALLLAAGAAAAPFAARAAFAQAGLRPITIGFTSKNATDWISFVADKLGFFIANGVKPEFITVGSAAGNAQQLTANSTNLAGISSTQIIEAVQGGAPLQAVANRTHTTPYVVIGKKGVPSIKALKGKLIIVGGPNDVTRIMLDGVLAGNGLTSDDVTYTFAGGTPERFAALMSGTVDAAILLPPFEFRATAQGYPILAEVAKFFPTFPLDLIGANVGWAKDHADLIEAYFRGFLTAVRWIYDPANRAQALSILAEATNTAPEDALKSYDTYVRGNVFSQTGITPLDGMDKVIATLARINVLKPPLPPSSKFVDNHFIENAAAQLRARK